MSEKPSLVILMGLPGSGKSTFYHHRFSGTHIRVNLDMLRTRHREKVLIEACLQTRQPLVVDNTNVSRRERARYILAAKENHFRVEGYLLHESVETCLQRNELRPEGVRVPRVAVLAKKKDLEFPDAEEGFDALFLVRSKDNEFIVEEWQDEV